MSLRLGIVADLHHSLDPGETGAWHNPFDFAGLPARVARAMAWFAAERVDAVVLAGDLTHRGDGRSLREMIVAGQAASRPLLVVGGNHDLASDGAPLAPVIEPSGPDVTLADSVGQLRSGVRVAGVQVCAGTGRFQAVVRDAPAVAAWGDEPVVLISHYPLLSRASALAERGMPYPGDAQGAAEAATALRDRRAPTVIVCGHMHARDFYVEGPVLQLAQGAMIEPPYDAVVLDVRPEADGRVDVDRRTQRMGDARSVNEPVLTPATAEWSFADGAWTPAETLS